MLRKMSAIAVTAAIAAASFWAAPAKAEYPEEPVTLVVGFAPGGGTDSLARAIASKMEESLGQTIIVDNRGGSGGAVAASYIARQEPDGYTIGMGLTPTFSFDPHQGRVDFTKEDFQYLAVINDQAVVFLAQADQGYSDWAGLITQAKEDGFLRYGTTTPADRMIMQIVSAKEGFELDFIAATGGAPAQAALIAGDADLVFSGGAGIRLAEQDDRIFPIAVANPERLSASPDIPTLNELGYDLEYISNHVIYAPSGLPDDAASKLESAIDSAIRDPEIVSLIERLNHDFVPRIGAEAAEVVDTSESSFLKLMSESN